MLLGITIDSNLTFENQIDNICKRLSQKLNALARVAPTRIYRKEEWLCMNEEWSFVTSQFGYSLLIWMFHRRRLHNIKNSIHKWALRTIYQDYIPTC